MAASRIGRFLLRRPSTFPQVALDGLIGAAPFFVLGFFASGRSWTAAGLAAAVYAVAVGAFQVVLIAARRYNANTERIVRRPR